MRKKFGLGILYISFLVGCLLVSGTAACSKTSDQTTSGEVPEPNKPSAPISIAYTVPAKASVGETVEVTIKFSPLSDAEELTLTLTGGNDLQLVSPESEINYGTQSMNSAFSETFTVTPLSEGIRYLNVFIAGMFDGNRMVRTGAVPIKVGSGNGDEMLKKLGRITSDAEGQKIVIMPAQESRD